MKQSLHIALPDWASSFSGMNANRSGDEAQMQVAIELARENVVRGTGGPFGAAVFEVASGRFIGAGVNSVERLRNSVLHAEILALMLAEAEASSFSLHGPNVPEHVLVTTCEPCAMCLGAILWSGVRRVVCAATRDDALRIGFDEGPVFAESYEYLRKRGVSVVRNVLAADARAVMELYRVRGGLVYNG
jgi:tRNA(Arg) A34 adenosine deaminase TadA